MKTCRMPRYILSAMLVLMLFLLAGCPRKEGRSKPTDLGTGGYPGDPGVNNLAGKVIGTINRKPLSDVQVTANGKTTYTDIDGMFILNDVGKGSFGVEISGRDVYTRLAAVDTDVGRSVLLDAIEISSPFHLGFYRELARGNHPNEKQIFPTHRWVSPTPPTFYIDTNASVTLDGVIDATQIDIVKQVIEEVVPVFTGNLYTAETIELKPFKYLDFDKDVPDNAFVISFDDRLMWQLSAFGVTFTDPDLLLDDTSFINKAVIRLVDDMSYYAQNNINFNQIAAHEIGHGFGFRHTSILPSIMMPRGGFQGLFNGLYSQHDSLHMAVVYRRPAGNLDPDSDPIPGVQYANQAFGRQVFVDRCDIQLPPEKIKRLQALSPTDKMPVEDFELIRNSLY